MSKLRIARTAVQTALNAIPSLSGLGCVLEQADADIETTIEAQLQAKGVSIAVLAPAAGIADANTSATELNVILPVVILENRTVNFGTGGFGQSSEDIVELVIKALIGAQIGDGFMSLAPAAFARIEDEDGLITHVINFNVPVVLRH